MFGLIVSIGWCCIFQRLAAEKQAQEETEKREKEHVEKIRREEEERLERKRVTCSCFVIDYKYWQIAENILQFNIEI